MGDSPLKLLVVDDSIAYRKIIRDVLKAEPNIHVVGVASDGRIALEKMRQLRPDLLTLDIEMPQLNGLDVLREMQQSSLEVGAIMLSAFTNTGAKLTTAALGLGAFDFVLKPNGANLQANLDELRRQLLPKIATFATTRGQTKRRNPVVVGNDLQRSFADTKALVVAIGVSTGGPAALARVLPMLPADLPVPILVVQHMPPLFTKSLADDLNRLSDLHICEAESGQLARPGTVYVARGGKQMKVTRTSRGVFLRLTDDEAENGCRPSVDYLFRSVSTAYGSSALGIILTGMGDDGRDGCRALKRQSGSVIAQHEASCVVYGMPRQVVDAGLADAVLPLDEIADEIHRCTVGEPATCR